MAIKTAWRTTCYDWAYNGCKVQPGFQFSPALIEWVSVGIWLRPLGNAAYVACLPLLCQGSKWLNGKSVWLVFRRSWVQIPAGSQVFFRGFVSHSPSKNIVNRYKWSVSVGLIILCLHEQVWFSLVPRPSSSFPLLAILEILGSWVRRGPVAWQNAGRGPGNEARPDHSVNLLSVVETEKQVHLFSSWKHHPDWHPQTI